MYTAELSMSLVLVQICYTVLWWVLLLKLLYKCILYGKLHQLIEKRARHSLNLPEVWLCFIWNDFKARQFLTSHVKILVYVVTIVRLFDLPVLAQIIIVKFWGGFVYVSHVCETFLDCITHWASQDQNNHHLWWPWPYPKVTVATTIRSKLNFSVSLDPFEFSLSESVEFSS